MVAFADTPIRAHVYTSKNAYPRFRDAILSTKYFDDETELAYYGLRYYSPEMGRWISRDPIGEQGGINQYSGMANAMPNRIDFLGLLAPGVGQFEVECGGIFGLFSQVAGTIAYDYFVHETQTGSTVPSDPGQSAPYQDVGGADLTMVFWGEDNCCCPSGMYRWKQIITFDDTPTAIITGVAAPPDQEDGDPATLPWYDSFVGQNPAFGDRSWEPLRNLWHPLDWTRPKMVTVRFETELWCVDETDNTIGVRKLETVKWGYKIERLNSQNSVGHWYDIDLL